MLVSAGGPRRDGNPDGGLPQPRTLGYAVMGSVRRRNSTRRAPTCPGNLYPVTGQYTGNGHFSVTATYPSGTSVQPIGCADSITYVGTIAEPGCDTATVSWSNSSGLSGSFSWVQACQVPTGEANSVFAGWDDAEGQPTLAIFTQYLAPTTFDWGGRQVSETSPQPGEDTCWDSTVPALGGPKNPTLTVTGGSPIVMASQNGVTTSYKDLVGATADLVKFYRRVGKTPCHIFVYQAMQIACDTVPKPNALQTFANNQDDSIINQTTVQGVRGSVKSDFRLWGTPAPSVTLVPVMSVLLFSATLGGP